MKFKILIADDEKNIREGLKDTFQMEGYDTVLAANGKEAISFVDTGDIDLVITDLRMPVVTGQKVLEHIVQNMPGVPVIVLTGHGSIDAAVDAMRGGAYDFLTKPLNLDQLILIVKRALENRELSLQHKQLQKEVEQVKGTNEMVGKSPCLENVFEMIKKVAPTKASVLITGENGVGKELVADAIHNLSPRKGKSFVKVNCAALSESLLESELFGHEKGAFTGADTLVKGRFELAHGGTIFLDEIGDISPSVQVKILRVLQEHQFERVGAQSTIQVDVRVIAATNKNLEEAIKKGTFREDLYYRLNVVNINVPPLRERKDDIPLLISHYINVFAKENQKPVNSISPDARQILYDYSWPGNIRQLRNCIESAVVMSTTNQITPQDLPPTISRVAQNQTINIPIGVTLEQAQKKIIADTLSFYDNDKAKTAKILGIEQKDI